MQKKVGWGRRSEILFTNGLIMAPWKTKHVFFFLYIKWFHYRKFHGITQIRQVILAQDTAIPSKSLPTHHSQSFFCHIWDYITFETEKVLWNNPSLNKCFPVKWLLWNKILSEHMLCKWWILVIRNVNRRINTGT